MLRMASEFLAGEICRMRLFFTTACTRYIKNEKFVPMYDANVHAHWLLLLMLQRHKSINTTITI